MMSDDLIALALDKSLNTLKGVLQRAGAIHRKPGAEHKKHDQEETKDKDLHRERVRNGSRRVLGREVQRLQQRCNRPCKQTIQDMGEPELFRHKAAARW
jgi:hypothetical protein